MRAPHVHRRAGTHGRHYDAPWQGVRDRCPQAGRGDRAEERRIPEPGPGQTIYVEHDYLYFVDKNYLDVQTYFTSKGFENVTLNPLKDLITGWVTKEGTVKTVSIDGNTEFSKKQWYVGNEAIVISYHSF